MVGSLYFHLMIELFSLYTKIGFQPEGSSRQSLFRDGEWYDIIHMGF